MILDRSILAADDPQLAGVSPALAADFHRAHAALAEAISEQAFPLSLAELADAIVRGEYALHVFGDCALVATVEYDDALVGTLNVVLAAGELNALVREFAEMESIADEMGLAAVTISVRPAWARALKDQGYRKDAVYLRKDLDHGQVREEAR